MLMLSVMMWGCAGPKHATRVEAALPAAPAPLDVEALRVAFNAASDRPRVLVLLSTT